MYTHTHTCTHSHTRTSFCVLSCLFRLQRAVAEKQRQLRDMEHQRYSSSSSSSTTTSHSHPPSSTSSSLHHHHTTSTTAATTSAQFTNRERETTSSTPASLYGRASEGAMAASSKDESRHGVAERDRMEQKVREAIFSVPLSTHPSSSSTPHGPVVSTATPVSFHSRYHGDTTAEQLHNNRSSRQAQPRDSWRYNSTGAYGSGPKPPLYSPSAPGAIQRSPPPFIPSPAAPTPIPTPTPHIPPSPQPSQPRTTYQHQATSQEWTEYTSAPSEGGGSQTQQQQQGIPTPTGVGTLSPTPSSNQATTGQPPNRELDISEFDPIRHS